MSNRSMAKLALWARPAPIIGIALLLRLLWATFVPVDPVSDSVLYEAFARSIASGHGYAFPDGTLTEYWPVGTSAFYALLYHAFGVRPWVLAVSQAFLGTYIVYLTWRLAYRMIDATVAAAAAWLTAIWPLLIEFTTILASELLFIALVLTSLNIWISRRIPLSFRMILWASTIAAATYVRPTALPLLIVFPATQWFIDRNGPAFIKRLLIVAVSASLLLAPWTYRSITLFDRFLVVSANGGVNLWMGNNPQSAGGYMDLPDRKFANEVDRDHFYGHEAVNFILMHPLEYVRLSMRRAVTTFDRETIGIVWNQKALASICRDTTILIIKRISNAYWWVLMLSGCIGLFLILQRRLFGQTWPLIAIWAYFSAFPVLTVAMDRYHVPIDPLLAIFAAYTFCGIKRRNGAIGASD